MIERVAQRLHFRRKRSLCLLSNYWLPHWNLGSYPVWVCITKWCILPIDHRARAIDVIYIYSSAWGRRGNTKHIALFHPTGRQHPQTHVQRGKKHEVAQFCVYHWKQWCFLSTFLCVPYMYALKGLEMRLLIQFWSRLVSRPLEERGEDRYVMLLYSMPLGRCYVGTIMYIVLWIEWVADNSIPWEKKSTASLISNSRSPYLH